MLAAAGHDPTRPTTWIWEGVVMYLTKAEVEAPANSRYRDVQADKTHYEAELRKLDLAERRGQLVSVAAVVMANERCAAAIVREVDAITMRAAEMTAAVHKEGEQGARRAFKQIAFKLKDAIARVLRNLGR